MKLKRLFLVVLACMTLGWVQARTYTPGQAESGEYVIFVDQSVAEDGDGSAWGTAAKDLAEVLNDINTNQGYPTPLSIWVAAGTYYPTTADGSREATFKIPAGVKVYGGFKGTEMGVDERTIPSTSETASTLSGNIGEPVNTDNVYHVVTIAGDGVVLDGFTIRDGFTTQSEYGANFSGAGIYSTYNVTLRNLFVTKNSSYDSGGGIYASNGLVMESCIVSDNTANGTNIVAGGIYLTGTGSSTIRNSLICHNTGTKCTDVSIDTKGTVKLLNTTIASKTGGYEIYAVGLFGNSSLTLDIENSIIAMTKGENAIRENNGERAILNCKYSYVQKMREISNVARFDVYENCIDSLADPASFFKNLEGGDYTLVKCSPLVNAGSDVLAGDISFDLAGKSRIFDEIYATVDIGCYEFQEETKPRHVLTLLKEEGEEEEDVLNQNIVKGEAITNISFTYSGGATDFNIEGLPAGLAYNEVKLDEKITISGAPAVFGTHHYTITTKGPTDECVLTKTINGTITITPVVSPTEDGILYVVKGATGNGSGSGWDNALGELSTALLATKYYPEVKQIWVGTGTPGEPATFTPAYAITEESDYTDGSATDRDNTFLLLNGIKIYGGFDPDNTDNPITSLEDKRNSSLTILSGLLSEGEGEEDDIRAYHVVTAVNRTGTTGDGDGDDKINHIVVDGFTITGGQADGESGVTVGDFYVGQSSGAGVHAQAGEGFITITASEIHDNTANYSGGGIYADAEKGSIYITGNTIQSNTIDEGESAYGGGIYAYGYVKITENEISENKASGSFEARGGGIYASYNKSGRDTGGGAVSFPIITSFAAGDVELEPIQAMYIGYNQITGNSALNDDYAAGGGIALWNYSKSSSGNENFAPVSIGVDESNRALIVYNTLEGNTAGNEGGSGNTGGGISAGYREEEGDGGNEENSANSMLLRAATEVRFSGNVVIGYNLLKGNTVYGDGGGIYTGLDDASISIVNNVIVENTAANNGGGIYLPGIDYSTTINNTITGNTAGNNGGGIYHDDSGEFTDIFNTILYGNQADGSDGDLYLYEYAGGSGSWIRNNLIGLGGEPLTKGNGNIIGYQGDVVFAGGEDEDIYYSLAAGSPAINAGVNWPWEDLVYPADKSVDFIRNNRIFGPAIDMGAYEDINCFQTFTTNLGGDGSTTITVVPDENKRVYVKDYGNGNTKNSNGPIIDGNSWATAHDRLADVLLYAQYYPTCVSEIWVAEGTYYPEYRLAEYDDDEEATTSRDKTFFIADGVHMYGGFDPAATNNYDDKDDIVYRNWNKWKTVLDGNLGDSDKKEDNAYHVVAVPQLSALTEFNGFIIRNGYATHESNSSVSVGEGISFMRKHGAGMYINYDRFEEGTQTFYVKNTVIKDNETAPDSEGDGGGVYIFERSVSVFVNTLIHSNKASRSGGGVYIGGPIPARSATLAPDNIPTFINVTIADNEAGGNGGGIYNNRWKGFYLANSIVWGNTADNQPSILIGDGSPKINYSIIEGLAGLSFEWTGDDNLDADPKFVNVNKGDYRLRSISPAIDKGNNEDYYTIVGEEGGGSLAYERDLAAVLRITGGAIDMGAYEYDPTCIPVMVWLGGMPDDSKQDWNTEANWYPPGIPASCTDVYIPGKSVEGKDDKDYLFPSLTDDKANNVCARIFFLPGAQLGRPDLLTYTEAHVEIDYGNGSLDQQAGLSYTDFVTIGTGIKNKDRVKFAAQYSGAPLERNRWNMLSAPLKEIVTGDFAFGGFPFSFIRTFAAESSTENPFIKGTWADFKSTTKSEFDPGQGFVHFFYDYETEGSGESLIGTPYGMDNSAGDIQWDATKLTTEQKPKHRDGTSEFGLAQQNGILHFPYFADGDFLSPNRRVHEYKEKEAVPSDGTGTSTFNFVYQSPLTSNQFLQFTGESETVDRSSEAYRFIFDDFISEGDWTFDYIVEGLKENTFVLVGNPFMSALNFDAFQGANPSIKPSYQIYTKNKTDADEYYIYGGGGNDGKYIAPMQSFLVESLSPGGFTGELSLNFTPEMAVTSNGTKLRSSRTIADRLTITASNPNGASSAAVRWLDDAKDGFCYRDVSKIINSVDTLPRVYTLVGMENGKQRALAVNSIQSNRVVVPVGVTSQYKGDVTFTITGMDMYDADISFVDAATGARQDITGLGEFTYTYTHDGNKVSVEDRFYLHFSKAPTGMEDLEAAYLTAYAQDADLIVLSSDGNPVERVVVYDIQGRLVSEHRLSGSSPYRVKNAFEQPGIYAVKIYTIQAVSSIKVIR